MSGQRPVILLIAATLFSLALVIGALVSRGIGLVELSPTPEPAGFVLEGSSFNVGTGGNYYEVRPDEDPLTLTFVMTVNGVAEEVSMDVYPGYALRFGMDGWKKDGKSGAAFLVTEYSVKGGLGWALPTPIFRRHFPETNKAGGARSGGDNCLIWGDHPWESPKGPMPGELCEISFYESNSDHRTVAYRIDYLTI